MAIPRKNITFRVTQKQLLRLRKLQEKMALDRSGVLNLAIKRLADAEGIR